MTGEGGNPFPWDWMLLRALECGMSVEAFWASTPRAIVTLIDVQNEMQRKRAEKQPPKPTRNARGQLEREAPPVRLSRIPR